MGLDDNQLRKLEHLEIVLNESVEGPNTTFFEYVFIPHQAYSDLTFDDIDLRVRVFGKDLQAPIFISGMTGGAPGTEKINEKLAEVAEKYGLGLGVGSQRAAIENPSLQYTFKVVRKHARSIPVLANIGAHEFVKYDMRKILDIINMIEADALAIHLNIAQEMIQLEGTPTFKNLLIKVGEVLKEISIPIVIKEVGNGLSYEVVKAFHEVGVNHFDVQGAGGTNWVLVEKYRALRKGNTLKGFVADNIADVGIPTAASIVEARNAAPNAFIIGSGGIRKASDVIKALRLGADAVGLASPILKAYFNGVLEEYLHALLHGVKACFILSGSRNVSELRTKPVIITSLLKEWITARGIRV
ncbi:MAG: type 2 isopentenyl-diphosphate Delta-isomerase [Zestosphaera tikiterensis]|uniref:Isopentenyl-diphosphate delta-isomerase n=1 Tax=Zestosphaera tikiterensis TaxID=1973259 RepID=A0A2R7Y3T3_9CREN|nr:MAG: type 2 isopentenyl-diphosphate Delta-isomerase [Zestosphaera tikiterensis]